MENNCNYKLLVGHIGYEELELGFWFLKDKNEYKWRFEKIPEVLKVLDAKVAVMAIICEQEMSIYMSGNAIKIIEFEIL